MWYNAALHIDKDVTNLGQLQQNRMSKLHSLIEREFGRENV